MRHPGAAHDPTMPDHTLEALNDAPSSAFVAALGGIFEHAPWVAAATAGRRPFATLADLFGAMRQVVRESNDEHRVSLLRGHPELAGTAARSGNMTSNSVAEQAGAGLDRLSGEREVEFDRLNALYRERFSMPFVICVRRHGRDSVLSEFHRRVALEPEVERETALAEVFRIAALRLDAQVAGPDRLPVAGRLSTHVLDTASGLPAEGVRVDLVEIAHDGERPVSTAVTDAGGRTEPPLVGGRPIPIGTYELRFRLGDYYRARDVALPEPAFLDIVPIRFGVAEPERHYHVPLAASPWSYSTYCGS